MTFPIYRAVPACTCLGAAGGRGKNPDTDPGLDQAWPLFPQCHEVAPSAPGWQSGGQGGGQVEPADLTQAGWRRPSKREIWVTQPSPHLLGTAVLAAGDTGLLPVPWEGSQHQCPHTTLLVEEPYSKNSVFSQAGHDPVWAPHSHNHRRGLPSLGKARRRDSSELYPRGPLWPQVWAGVPEVYGAGKAREPTASGSH